jgi:hypothetical protein
MHRRRLKKLHPCLRQLHQGATHALRDFTAELVREPRNLEMVGSQAAHLATEFRIGMGNLLELSENRLHCSLKMYSGTPGGGLQLSTWTKSQPTDHRPRKPSAVPTSKTSTIYAALRGESDEHFKWPKLSCFCCNDLDKWGARYNCGRTNYRQYYRSTMVFAVRQMQRGKTGPATEIGFLAFDSLQANAFVGMPDVFDFVSQPDKYRELCDGSAAFHLGATYADLWGTVMLGLVQRLASDPGVKSVQVIE